MEANKTLDTTEMSTQNWISELSQNQKESQQKTNLFLGIQQRMMQGIMDFLSQ